jgi:HlyD family secretion protein
MTVSVNVETGRRDHAIVVPNDALGAVDGNRATVWLVVDGRAVRRQVQLGLRGLIRTEVTAGLRQGDRVLVEAPATLKPGDRVRVVPGAAIASTDAAATRKELPAKFD